MKNKKTNKEVAEGIRKRVFEHCIKNNGGYLSQACSAAEQLAWLYNDILNLGDSTQPMIPEEFSGVPSKDNQDYVTGAGYNGPFESSYDRLIIAPAHYALVAYATLIEVGRKRISLKNFEKIIIEKNRSNAGFSAPAHGLFLTEIDYDWHKIK